MKNLNACILSTIISTALIGCGGGDDGNSSSSLTDDTQKVTYENANLVEAFLNANVDYSATYKTKGYASKLTNYYDKDGNVVDFKIPTNTVAKYNCSAKPLDLNNRDINYNGASFNIIPLSNSLRLVNFDSLPQSFVNASFGKKACFYSNFSYSKQYIIDNSNQHIATLGEDEKVVELANFIKLSTANRLLNDESLTNIKDTKLLVKPYDSSTFNYASHEYIVSKSGEVKTYNNNTAQFDLLTGTKGKDWQYFSDKFIMSKPHGGTVTVYDVALKQAVSAASIDVMQNLDTNIKNVESATLSYGIWPSIDTADNSKYGIPFKIVSENYGNDKSLYLWENNKWVKSNNFTTQMWYKLFKAALKDTASIAKNDDNNVYINPKDNRYFAAKNISNSGFDLVAGKMLSTTVNPVTISDFSDHFVGLQVINGKVIVETSDQVLNNEHKSFYIIDNNKKMIIGNTGENITTVYSSSHN
ncbi:hypothetical protein A3K86_21175 [Photobacterium jeanii]|uniref:Lipoprotein n=1 Tax=Photobacterium jeanii TaxID=858640 RepID=A0A178K3C0_9GAMM|nr:hypothetical protein [Photobacterium jeanii]OAN11455.1 hypothetical protein A3K86_21175 [Photobacterium jeanii]PST90975.1 hypothetical protein C9I91_10280 [Photobacterium jeanii]